MPAAALVNGFARPVPRAALLAAPALRCAQAPAAAASTLAAAGDAAAMEERFRAPSERPIVLLGVVDRTVGNGAQLRTNFGMLPPAARLCGG